MKARVVDLRYKMNDILKALERNEEVTVLYHGKVKGIIVPTKKEENRKMSEHPFFAMSAADGQESVQQTLDNLRKSRYHDL